MAINNWCESKSSAEQRTLKRGNDHVEHAPYQQVDKPCRMQSTETRTEKWTEESTEKSTGKVYQVNEDSIEASFQEPNHEVDWMVTEADFEWRLPSQAVSISQCHNRLQDILYRACWSTARRLGRVQVHFNLVSITTVREAYVSDVDERDVTTRNWLIQSMTTEVYDRCRKRKLPSMPSHERKLSTTLVSPTITYAEIYKLQGQMVGGVWVRKWRCGGYGSSSDVSFCSFCSFCSFVSSSSLLFSSLLIGFRPSTNCVSMGFYHLPMEVEFPRALDPPKGRHRAVPIGCGTYGFVRLRM